MTSTEIESLRDLYTALDTAVNDCGWRAVLHAIRDYFEGSLEDENDVLQELGIK